MQHKNTLSTNTLIGHFGLLGDVVVSNNVINKSLRIFLLISFGVSLLILSAKTQIPFYPVPMTLQTMIILLIGLAYGSTIGVATVISYLALGALALPVFAGAPEKGIGITYMIGPTGGFLLGMLIATYVMGKFSVYKYDRSYALTFLAMLVGEVIIFACGLAYMGILLGWDKPILQWGLIPFISAEALKIIFVTMLMPTIWKFAKNKKVT